MPSVFSVVTMKITGHTRSRARSETPRAVSVKAPAFGGPRARAVPELTERDRSIGKAGNGAPGRGTGPRDEIDNLEQGREPAVG